MYDKKVCLRLFLAVVVDVSGELVTEKLQIL